MHIKKSISTRLSTLIIIFTGVLFVSFSVIVFNFSRDIIRQEAFIKADLLLDNINKETNFFFTMVSNTVDDSSWSLDENKLSVDSMYSITNYILYKNQNIKGSAIALDPKSHKNKYLAPYSYKHNGKIINKRLDKSGDYTKEIWFYKAKNSNKGVWSDPYFDTLGAQIVMTTYSKQIYNKNGKFEGVITADISLDWLSDVLQKVKPYKSATIMIVCRNGNIILNESENGGLKQLLSDTLKSVKYRVFDKIKEEINKEVDKVGEIELDGKESFIFHRTIEGIGWSLVMTCHKEDIYEDVNTLAIWMFPILLISLALLFIFCHKIIHHVMLPLKTLTTSANIIAEGDFHAPLPQIATKDELSQLSTAFGSMQTSLAKYIAELKNTTTIKERIESELRIGSKIQVAMLPHTLPKFNKERNIGLFATLKTAKEVGGDLYDYIVRDEKLYFIIGDVSGKGVPAALQMAMITSLFHYLTTISDNPENIVTEINRYIVERNSYDMFATLIVGVLLPDEMKIKLCNAGHNPPIILSKGAEASRVEITPNLAAGVYHNVLYKADTVNLKDGDIFVLYTDGVTEAENDKKELFGEDRLLKALSTVPPFSSRLVIAHILKELEQYIGGVEQSDDIATMAIRIGGTKAYSTPIKNRIQEIDKLVTITEEIKEKTGIDQSETTKLNIVLEELISNIILYGYNPKREDDIIISYIIYKGTITFIVSDQADKFDITSSAPKVDITQSVEERPIGGLGIFLINSLMDKIEHLYVCGYNITIMEKQIKNRPE